MNFQKIRSKWTYMSSSHSQPSTEYKQLDINKYLVLTIFNRVKYVDTPKYRQCPLNNETAFIMKKQMNIFRSFIINFQHNPPPALHNAEILYTGPRKGAKVLQ